MFIYVRRSSAIILLFILLLYICLCVPSPFWRVLYTVASNLLDVIAADTVDDRTQVGKEHFACIVLYELAVMIHLIRLVFCSIYLMPSHPFISLAECSSPLNFCIDV